MLIASQTERGAAFGTPRDSQGVFRSVYHSVTIDRSISDIPQIHFARHIRTERLAETANAVRGLVDPLTLPRRMYRSL
jgi:hypothetical protein